jgi:HAD superfamily hydrolase (TIGR01509 family)
LPLLLATWRRQVSSKSSSETGSPARSTREAIFFWEQLSAPCLQPGRKVKLKGEMIEFTCQAFLFDMDGVLADSTPAVGRVWAQWAREHNLDPEEVVRRAHGRPSLTTIREYLPESDHLQENREIERRELAGVEEIVTFPGAQQLLASLPEERWAVVTSSTRRLAEARHRATGLFRPRCFITCDDVTRGKPDPSLTCWRPRHWGSPLPTAWMSKTWRRNSGRKGRRRPGHRIADHSPTGRAASGRAGLDSSRLQLSLGQPRFRGA